MASLCVLACRPGQLLFPKRDAYIGKSLQTYGEWTEGITRLCGQMFSPGQTVMEVGAGWGTRTVGLARLLGAGGRVIAIEQSRRLTDLLHANCALNALDNVKVVQARAQALPGAADVIEPDFNNEGNFGAVLAKMAVVPGKPYVDGFVIDDSIWGRIDGLLIDAPGNAHEILMGARTLIATCKPPIVINADNPTDAKNTREFLRDAGYRLWSYSCPFFSTENFFRQQKNVFGNLASQCIVAVTDDRDLSTFLADLTGCLPVGPMPASISSPA
jgi:FkbM family methyltransferase